MAKYVVVGEFGYNSAFAVDWDKYQSYPWWKRPFVQNRCIVGSGDRTRVYDMVDQLNNGTMTEEEAHKSSY